MTSRGVIYRGETRVLDETARAAAPGEFVHLSQGQVHYEYAGPPAPQTVVLVPGLSVPYSIWDPTFDFLVNTGLPVLRYDLYGRGYSDRPDVHYDQDLMDQQLLDLLDGLKIDKADLVGLSLGGAISAVFTARHPERVGRLCLIDPAGLPRKLDLPGPAGPGPHPGRVDHGLYGRQAAGLQPGRLFFWPGWI